MTFSPFTFGPNKDNNFTNNAYRGSGFVFAATLDEDGNEQGMRHLGDASAFNLSASTETTRILTGSGAVATDLISSVSSISFAAGMTLRNIDKDTLGLFFLNTPTTISDGTTAVSNAVYKVRRNSYIKLGSHLTSNPMGVSAVATSGFAITSGSTGNTAVPSANYTLDATNGVVYFKPSFHTDDTPQIVRISYTPVDKTKDFVILDENPQSQALALWYFENTNDVPADNQWNFHIPTCQIVADQSVEWMSRDTAIALPFSLNIQAPRKAGINYTVGVQQA